MTNMRALGIVALLLMCSLVLSAQDLTGDWQGALGAEPRQLRVIVPGLGNTDHIFDVLAPKLAAHYFRADRDSLSC
jgi:hypothetical protein